MTTLPPGSDSSPLPEIHKHRQVAEGFGADAERYDRARPSYPAELIDWILESAPGRDVLDVGAGTGIVGRLFQARDCRVLGVEPDERMAEVARRRGLDAEVSKIEDWDPAGRAFDAAVAGQAWHWVDPAAGAATLARALRPGGRAVLFWNVYQAEDKARVAFGEVFARAYADAPFSPWKAPAGSLVDGYLKLCDKAADGMAQTGEFGEPEKWQQAWDRSYTRDEYLDVVPTMGGMTRLPAEVLARLLDGLGEAVDTLGGSVIMNFTTVAVAASRS